jgi:hypothetical protein
MAVLYVIAVSVLTALAIPIYLYHRQPMSKRGDDFARIPAYIGILRYGLVVLLIAEVFIGRLSIIDAAASIAVYLAVVWLYRDTPF